MTQKTTLTLFYSAIGLICVAVIFLSRFLHHQNEKSGEHQEPIVVNIGKQEAENWFEIKEDLVATNQEGREIRLSDLKGKVWLAANFFAICPMCAQRNAEELHKIYQAFGDHSDFHIVCISVDPENDDVDRLSAYSKALNADPKNWWFLNAGSEEKTHRYIEEQLKFFGVRERRDPDDIASNGRFAHDLSFILVDRDFHVIGKWPLADARSPEAREREPDLYEELQKDLFEKIRAQLERDHHIEEQS